MWAVCLCARPLFAQQGGEDNQTPAARNCPPLLDPNGNQEDSGQGTQTIEPDNWPVSGVQNTTLGAPEIRHSYWVPGIRYSNSIGSNNSNSATGSQWNSTSFVSGDVSLLEAWSHSLLSANYSGGGFTSTDSTQGNGQFHQLSAAYEFDRQRWQWLFVEQFCCLCRSCFCLCLTNVLSTAGTSRTLSLPS